MTSQTWKIKLKKLQRENNMPHEIGTPEYIEYLQKMTPGEAVDTYIREAQKQNKDAVSNTAKAFSQVFDNPLKGFPYNEEFEVHLKEAKEEYPEDLDESDADASLKKKAEKTGMPFGILKQVFKRGVAAWRTGHRPGTNPTQWGHARVNSFATKSKGTWGGADKDLAAKVRG
tara:strand:- start:1106 stop:1621 length:516 start_codon:yes stop_codon:yes gene_type:complete